MNQLGKRRSYVSGSLVGCEEDATHEFKGHRNLSEDEVPPWCYIRGTNRRSRKSASRSINAFLNSGRGGTVYLGITDQGVCEGICLTKYQIDHTIVALKDLMKRYKPNVPDHMYSMEFIPSKPVANSSEDIRKDDLAGHMKCHLLRTSDPCWCDLQAAQDIEEGKHIPRFIIEITILPQQPGFRISDDGSYHLQLPRLYANEEGHYYFRQNASCVQYSMQEIYDLTIEQINDAYRPIVENLTEELSRLSLTHTLQKGNNSSRIPTDTEKKQMTSQRNNERDEIS